MPRDTEELLRATMDQAGVPSAVDKRIRNFRTSIAAMMGEEAPKQLIDFDNHLLNTLETIGPAQPDILTERVNEAVQGWGEEQRPDLYSLSPDELRDSLIKLEDLSFRDGVRVALEDPRVVRSMFVLLKSGNIDYRKGAIFTLEEVAKRRVDAIDFDLLHQVVTGPFAKEERIMLIENSTEFGRIVGRMVLDDKTHDEGLRLVRELATSNEDTQLRVALKTFTHLSKVAPEKVDIDLVRLGLRSGNDFNRETTARIVQNLAKNAPDKVDDAILEEMASDSTWSVRQVSANALANLSKHDPARADAVADRLAASGEPERVKVAERAKKAIAKKRK